MMTSSDDSSEKNEEDRLKDIHHHLSRNKSASSSWLPLESNPAIFTSYARSTSHLPQTWEFVDVLGFGGGASDDLLLLSPTESNISNTVAGAIFLFPTTDAIYADRGVQKVWLRKHDQSHHNILSRHVFHVEQVKGFGNACGSIAATHILLNSGLALPNIPDPFNESGGIASPLSAYKNACINVSNNDQDQDCLRRQRGEMLVKTQELHNISDRSAQSTASQTQCPESGDTYLGHHYCAFVPVKFDGKIYVVELDGTKIRPIDHGTVEENNYDHDDDDNNNAFLRAVANVVKRKWMALEPNRIDFSLMALVKKAT
eukprot:scaffold22492_cov138-Skeletonema_menzelii.AAC.5